MTPFRDPGCVAVVAVIAATDREDAFSVVGVVILLGGRGNGRIDLSKLPVLSPSMPRWFFLEVQLPRCVLYTIDPWTAALFVISLTLNRFIVSRVATINRHLQAGVFLSYQHASSLPSFIHSLTHSLSIHLPLVTLPPPPSLYPPAQAQPSPQPTTPCPPPTTAVSPSPPQSPPPLHTPSTQRRYRD